MRRQFLVGRQPIFDERLEVHGYELLFRDGPGAGTPGVTMTADVLVHAGLDLGLERVVGTKLAFVNATREFLVGDHDVPLPAEQTVIEVLEGLTHDDELVAGCRRLTERGYALALDDYEWREGDEPLLELASIVKLDVLAIPAADLARQAERCAAHGARLLAEKVERRDQLAACRRLGFELFQGYLLSRPETVSGGAVPPNRLACLRLVDKLCAPDASAGELERIVETDAGLSQRVLQAAGNGAARGLRRQVSSIREAVVLLGWRRLRSWVVLMLVSDARQGADEQLALALIRARMCELLAEAAAPRLADSAFTVGLVSALELLLDVPLPEIVEHLSITDELGDALVHRQGRLGDLLDDALSWELGCPGPELRSGLPAATLERAYLDALGWSADVLDVLAGAS